jgi:RecA-family ATPase
LLKKAEAPAVSPDWFANAVKAGSIARFLDNPKPELDFIFIGTLLAGTVGLLVGPGAAGKSTLLLLMMMAIATGRDILPGIFTPTMAGKVLGIFAEDGEEVLHHRVRPMSDALFFYDPEAQDRLRENMCVVTCPGHDLRLFSDDQRRLAETAFFQMVYEAAKKIDGLRLLVIDPLSRFHGGSENDNGAGTFFISLLERIAQETGAAVLCCHHVGKFVSRDSKGGFSLEAAMSQDAARGASGLTNGARWQCNLFGLPDEAA